MFVYIFLTDAYSIKLHGKISIVVKPHAHKASNVHSYMLSKLENQGIKCEITCLFTHPSSML